MVVTKWSDHAAAAAALVGNWRKFESFSWYERPEHAEMCCLVYTHNRDSEALDVSNAEAIKAELMPWITGGDDAEVCVERHNHWAVGWVEGFAIRVYRPGLDGAAVVTEAFKRYCEVRERLENYPVLDEEDFCRREWEEAIGLIEDIGRRKLREGAPEDWASDVLGELNEYSPGSIRTDRVLEAMRMLDLLEVEES
jgi:hypothetical protein